MNIDKRTIQVAGGLFVIVPMLWGLFAQVISIYEKWDTLNSRVNRLERWRCAMGSKPPETLDWQRSMAECRARWEDR